MSLFIQIQTVAATTDERVTVHQEMTKFMHKKRRMTNLAKKLICWMLTTGMTFLPNRLPLSMTRHRTQRHMGRRSL